MLATLRNRNFSLLWFGGLISLMGDWVLNAALPFYVYQETHSTLIAATMVAAEMLPLVLLGSLAGVFVDRWDRRRVLLVTSVIQAVLVLLLLLVQSLDQLWIVFLVAFGQSCAGVFFGPAENALLPSLVGKDQLLTANSLNALNNKLGRLIGPPLGGFLLATVGLSGVVVLDSISFALSALLIALVTVPPVAREAVEKAAGVAAAWNRLWSEWIDGLRYVWRTHIVATVFTVLVLISFGGIMFDPLTSAFVIDILRGGPEVMGWLMTVQAVGGICGGLVVGHFGKDLEPGRLLGWSCTVTGLFLLIEFNVPSIPVTYTMSFLIGISATATSVAAQTLIQRNVPDEYLGRASGALGTTIGLLSLFSVLGLAGVLGEVVGLLPMLNLATGITILAGIIGIVLLAPGIVAAVAARREPASD